MDFNVNGSDNPSGTGAFKYSENGNTYVYTQCEPDFTQQIIPVFYNLNHKAVFKLGFILKKVDLVVSNMNVQTTEGFEGQEDLAE